MSKIDRIWMICSDDNFTPIANHFEPLVRLGFYQDEGLAMDVCHELNETWRNYKNIDDSDATFYYVMEVPAYNKESLDGLMNPKKDLEKEKLRWEMVD